jgi:cobalamin synthase
MKVAVPVAQGLGAGYVRELRDGDAALACLIGLGLAALSIGVWIVPAGGIGLLVVASVARSARRRVGGITGDFLGTVEQIVEISVFLLGAAAVYGADASPAWWA